MHVDFKVPFFSSKRARYFLRVLFTINIFVCIISILAYCYNNKNISSLLRMISTEHRICIYFLSLSKKYTAGDNKKAIMLRWLEHKHTHISYVYVCTCSYCIERMGCRTVSRICRMLHAFPFVVCLGLV